MSQYAFGQIKPLISYNDRDYVVSLTDQHRKTIFVYHISASNVELALIKAQTKHKEYEIDDGFVDSIRYLR